MPDTKGEAAGPSTARLRFAGATYACRPGETVLETLLRHGAEVPYSCCKGVCLTCMLRADEGAVPPDSQEGLSDTLRDRGCFLPCVTTPSEDLSLGLPDAVAVFGRAVVVATERVAPAVRRVFLEPATPLYYRAGQFVNLRRGDGLTRSYSLASVPRLDRLLEVHVKRLPGGRMSNWIFDELEAGESLDIQGPNGACYYLPGRLDQTLLLMGNGTGLAPLIGIARDALHDGHQGPIHLYHGTRHADGLYLHRALEELAARHDNFHYAACLSGPEGAAGCRSGRCEAVAFEDHVDMTGYRVFLSGYPPMVHAVKKAVYLAGAALGDIYADPFELRELRRRPRIQDPLQIATVESLAVPGAHQPGP
jgi:NAD(P)H-flavin reductase